MRMPVGDRDQGCAWKGVGGTRWRWLWRARTELDADEQCGCGNERNVKINDAQGGFLGVALPEEHADRGDAASSHGGLRDAGGRLEAWEEVLGSKFILSSIRHSPKPTTRLKRGTMNAPPPTPAANARADTWVVAEWRVRLRHLPGAAP